MKIFKTLFFLILVITSSQCAWGEGWTSQTSGTTQNLIGAYFPSASVGYVAGNTGTIRKTIDGGVTWTGQSSGTTSYLATPYFPTVSIGYVGGDPGRIMKTTNGGTNWTSLTGQNWKGVHFPGNGNTGYVAGQSGAVQKTTDGGTTWKILPSGTTQYLRAVYFPVDTLTGYIVGDNGTIRVTTDGGATWNSQVSGTTQTRREIYFPTGTTGYTAGDAGTIIKTTNGGSDWTLQTTPTSRQLRGIHFPLDAITGYACGDSGTVLKTTDGGANWVFQTTPTLVSLARIQFPVDANTGFAVGSGGTVLKTTDGGANWISKTSGTTSDIIGSHFPTASVGYITGNGGFIRKTTDGGETWVGQTSGNTYYSADVYFLNESVGYVVADGCRVLKTTNGGTNWTILAYQDIRGVHFPVDANTGFVAGEVGAIYKTQDGGTTWKILASGTTQGLQEIRFTIDTTTGYVVGGGGVILKTTDGGNSWNAQTSGTTNGIYSIQFPSTSVGYAVGVSGTILKTTNEGTNWVTQSSPTLRTLREIHFPTDITTGYVSGDSGTILKTTDGGTNWFFQYTPTTITTIALTAVRFPIDADTGHAVGNGGVILKTIDKGGLQMILHPTGNGSVNAFTTSSGCPSGHWDCVNDQSGNASSGPPVTNDGMTSYLRDGSFSTNREMFSLANGTVPSTSVIRAIEVRAYVASGTGSSQIASLSYQRMGTDASPIDGASTSITAGSCCSQMISSYWTGLNWTATQLDSLQIGIKHVSGGQVYISQIYVVVSYEAPAAASALAEISPNKVGTYSQGNSFTYDILPTIGGGSGVNKITVTVPPEFGAPTVTDVRVGGSPVSYSNNTSGNTIDVTLTSKVTTNSNIRILFTSNAPTTPVIRNFVSTVDDNITPSYGPQSTNQGNGDGDGGDANSWSVATDIKVDGTFKDWQDIQEFRDRKNDASSERTDIRHVYLTGSVNGDTLFGRINTDGTLTASDSVTLDIFLDTSSDAIYDYRLEMVVKTSGNTKSLYKNNPVDTLLSNDSLKSHTGTVATGQDTMNPGQGGVNQATEFSIPFSNIGNPSSALFLYFSSFVTGPGSAEDDRYPDKGMVKHDPIENKQTKADIEINEVFYKPVTGEEWIELYNGYPSGRNISGWHLTDEDGTTGNNQINLPNWTLPTKNYLVIHFGTGINDSNFIDTVGHYYSQNTTQVLDDEDQVALYDNTTRSASTVRDFVAWDDDTTRSSDAEADDNNAVIAAQWFDNEALVANIPIPDQSIGRDSLSMDTDSLDNWDKHGGFHAKGPSQSKKNKGGNANTLVRNILRNLSSGDITLSWESVSGVTYDILYADSLLGSWTDIADVSSGGTSTSWTDNGTQTPSHPNNVIQRYYKIQAQGGGRSINTVGKYRVTLQDSAMNLVSIPFVPFTIDLDTVIGTQLIGESTELYSDRIWKWSPVTNTYTIVWLVSGGPNNGKWWNTETGMEATITLGADEGFWIQNRHGVQNLTFVGEVSDLPNRTIALVKGVQLIGSAYPVEVSLVNSDLDQDGAKGAINELDADRVWEWDPVSETYKFAWLIDWPQSPYHGWWWDSSTGSATTIKLKPGLGLWIEIRDLSGHGDFIWTYPKPYSQPPN